MACFQKGNLNLSLSALNSDVSNFIWVDLSEPTVPVKAIMCDLVRALIIFIKWILNPHPLLTSSLPTTRTNLPKPPRRLPQNISLVMKQIPICSLNSIV